MSLSIVLIIVTSMLGCYRLIAHSQNMTDYNEDIYIGAKQLSQYVLGSQYIKAEDTYTYMNLEKEEMTILLDDSRVVKTPGFEILITHIDSLQFEIIDERIYMIVTRDEKTYSFVLTYAREYKEDIENESVE